MTKREELQKQYAEYERKAKELLKMLPQDGVLKIDPKNNNGLRLEVVYNLEDDELNMEHYDGDGDEVVGALTLSGDEAEKLYHFLGDLYG
jgi:hypothetical protein